MSLAQLGARHYIPVDSNRRIVCAIWCHLVDTARWLLDASGATKIWNILKFSCRQFNFWRHHEPVGRQFEPLHAIRHLIGDTSHQMQIALARTGTNWRRPSGLLALASSQKQFMTAIIWYWYSINSWAVIFYLKIDHQNSQILVWLNAIYLSSHGIRPVT